MKLPPTLLRLHICASLVLPCRWSQLAKQHKVAVYGALPQLPTFVLFEKGKEVGRIPHVFEGEGWAQCESAEALAPARHHDGAAVFVSVVDIQCGSDTRVEPAARADGSVASMKIRRQDIVVAFGLEDYLEASRTKKPVTPAASGKKSTKKR
jgi:hypothetical protein